MLQRSGRVLGIYTANAERIKGAHATDAQRLANARIAWIARAQRIQRTASELCTLGSGGAWARLACWSRTPSGADYQRHSEGDIKMPPKTKKRKAITDAGARRRCRAGRETRNKALLMLG